MRVQNCYINIAYKDNEQFYFKHILLFIKTKG